MSEEPEQPGAGTGDETLVDAPDDQVEPAAAAEPVDDDAPEPAHDEGSEGPDHAEVQALLDDPEQLREEARRLHEEALARRDEAQRLREEAERLREEAERLRAEPERLAVEAAALREEAEAARAIVATPLPDVPADAADPDADDQETGDDAGYVEEMDAPRKRGLFRRRREG
jgi:archaellum component FlaC